MQGRYEISGVDGMEFVWKVQNLDPAAVGALSEPLSEGDHPSKGPAPAFLSLSPEEGPSSAASHCRSCRPIANSTQPGPLHIGPKVSGGEKWGGVGG